MRAPWVALLLAACAEQPIDYLSDVDVERAHLESMDLTGIGIIGAGVIGSADLVIQPVGSDQFVVPVELGGGSVGLQIDLADVLIDDYAEINLPSHAVAGDELFGEYRGSREGFGVVAGLSSLHLANGDVHLDLTGPTVGLFSLYVSAVWLTIEPRDLPDTTSSTSTATTADSGVPLAPEPTTGCGRGCSGCSGPEVPTITRGSGDTGPTGTTTAETGTAETTTAETGTAKTGTAETGGTGTPTTTTSTDQTNTLTDTPTGATGETGSPPHTGGTGASSTGTTPTGTTPTGTGPGTTPLDTGPGDTGASKDDGCDQGCSTAGSGRALVPLILALGLIRRRRCDTLGGPLPTRSAGGLSTAAVTRRRRSQRHRLPRSHGS